jgi:hypothetical protein
LTRWDEDSDLAVEIMRKRMEQQTKAHLRDIRRVHGAGKHWASLVLPSGIPRFVEMPPLHSSFGSPGALCAANGERDHRIATRPD